MRNRENYRKYHSLYQRTRYNRRLNHVKKEMGNRCCRCSGKLGLRFRRKDIGKLFFPSFVLKAWKLNDAKEYIKRNYFLKCMFC